jgi:hypothetical protein
VTIDYLTWSTRFNHIFPWTSIVQELETPAGSDRDPTINISQSPRPSPNETKKLSCVDQAIFLFSEQLHLQKVLEVSFEFEQRLVWNASWRWGPPHQKYILTIFQAVFFMDTKCFEAMLRVGWFTGLPNSLPREPANDVTWLWISAEDESAKYDGQVQNRNLPIRGRVRFFLQNGLY